LITSARLLCVPWLVICMAIVTIGCKPLQTEGTAHLDSASNRQGDHSPIRVVATVGMVADMFREIGKSHVVVKQLMGPGVDPHLYKGTRDDVREILAADIIIYSGLMLEGKLIDILEKVSNRKSVVSVTKSLPPSLVLGESTDHGHPDPHVWMDVSTWSRCTEVVVETLVRHDPVNESDYRMAAEQYRSKLDELHRYGQQVISSIPDQGRLLITSHDAFQYFGRAYGLDVQGVQGLSTDSEAGLQQINSLVDTIVSRNIAAVFVESSVPRKSLLAVVDGAASRGHRVTIGGELYSDAMGAAGSYEGTYIGMLDHNLTTVARSLGGKAPTHGMQGLLTVESISP